MNPSDFVESVIPTIGEHCQHPTMDACADWTDHICTDDIGRCLRHCRDAGQCAPIVREVPARSPAPDARASDAGSVLAALYAVADDTQRRTLDQLARKAGLSLTPRTGEHVSDPTPDTTAYTESDWEALGRQAFHNGEHGAPALNATVMAHLAGWPVGSGEIDIMRAFSRGWDAANIAEPVPGVDLQA